MAKSTRQKRSHQDVGIVGAEPSVVSSGQSGADTCKKAKTSVENHGDVYLEYCDSKPISDIVI